MCHLNTNRQIRPTDPQTNIWSLAGLTNQFDMLLTQKTNVILHTEQKASILQQLLYEAF